MKRISWVRSGVTEELDARQVRLMEIVYGQIQTYYRELHQSRGKYQYPLTLSQLSRLCNKSNVVTLSAVRMLANSADAKREIPPVFYDRISSAKNRAHRPYRIFLRQ